MFIEFELTQTMRAKGVDQSMAEQAARFLCERLHQRFAMVGKLEEWLGLTASHPEWVIVAVAADGQLSMPSKLELGRVSSDWDVYLATQQLAQSFGV